MRSPARPRLRFPQADWWSAVDHRPTVIVTVQLYAAIMQAGCDSAQLGEAIAERVAVPRRAAEKAPVAVPAMLLVLLAVADSTALFELFGTDQT